MQRRGFQEETKWHSSGKLRPFSVQASRRHNFFDTLGRNFVQRFQSPTIFLKISCDGDFLFPIVVGIWSYACHMNECECNLEYTSSVIKCRYLVFVFRRICNRKSHRRPMGRREWGNCMNFVIHLVALMPSCVKCILIPESVLLQDSLDQFHFMRNLVDKLGCQVWS